MAFVTAWDDEDWRAHPAPLARLHAGWTDPATQREALEVMDARGGYSRSRYTRDDRGTLYWLDVVIPLTGPLIAVASDGTEQRFEISPPNPEGPETLTIELSWLVSSHSYPTGEGDPGFDHYATVFPERIEERGA